MTHKKRLKENWADMGPAVVSPDDQIMDPAANVKVAKAPVATNPVTGSRSLETSSDKSAFATAAPVVDTELHDEEEETEIDAVDTDAADTDAADADVDADAVSTDEDEEEKPSEVVSFAEALRRLREEAQPKAAPVADKEDEDEEVVFCVNEDSDEDEEKEKLDLELDDLSEDINAMTEGLDLPDSFKAKATAIYHAAVRRNVNEQVNRLSSAYDAYTKTEIRKKELREGIQRKLAEKRLNENADRYLTYVAEEWLAENRVAAETTVRVQLAEELMTKMRNLLHESMITVPAEKVDLVEKLENQVATLKNQLSQQIEVNISNTEKLNRTRREAIVKDLSEGLAASQAAKLRVLTENLPWTNTADFTKNVREIRESYFKPKVATAKPLNEQVSTAKVQIPAVLNESANSVDIYAQMLTRKK